MTMVSSSSVPLVEADAHLVPRIMLSHFGTINLFALCHPACLVITVKVRQEMDGGAL